MKMPIIITTIVILCLASLLAVQIKRRNLLQSAAYEKGFGEGMMAEQSKRWDDVRLVVANWSMSYDTNVAVWDSSENEFTQATLEGLTSTNGRLLMVTREGVKLISSFTVELGSTIVLLGDWPGLRVKGEGP